MHIFAWVPVLLASLVQVLTGTPACQGLNYFLSAAIMILWAVRKHSCTKSVPGEIGIRESKGWERASLHNALHQATAMQAYGWTHKDLPGPNPCCSLAISWQHNKVVLICLHSTTWPVLHHPLQRLQASSCMWVTTLSKTSASSRIPAWFPQTLHKAADMCWSGKSQ